MSELFRIAAVPVAIQIVLGTLMGVLPGMALSPIPPGPGVHPLSALEQQGRAVYVSEGCAYCHTQQVRPLPSDRPFGRPSAPGDFAYQTPELLGAHRTGPDLTNIGARQVSATWQYIHLFDPRIVVPRSVMPSYPWLFKVREGGSTSPADAVPLPLGVGPQGRTVVPSADAVALVAYLLALKQAPLPAPGAAPMSGESSPMSGESSAEPAAAASAPLLPAGETTSGSKVFASTCAGCHGPEGAGVTGVFPALASNEVVNAADPTEHINVVLHGLHGRAVGGTTYSAQMPAFGPQLSDQEIAAVIDFERTSWGNHGTPVSAQQVAAVRGAH
jgi:cytochrome c oxidase cbb3-type subunit 2